jgi:hypothetical protein
LKKENNERENKILKMKSFVILSESTREEALVEEITNRRKFNRNPIKRFWKNVNEYVTKE